MIRVGKYSLGFPQASMIAVFIALSVCAVVASLQQSRPEWPMPFWQILLVNEGMALLATLIYGIFAHFITAIISHRRKMPSKP